MAAEHNLKPMRKGDTYVLPLEFYDDACEETPKDVSTYVFKLTAKNQYGAPIFTWNNSDFVQVATNKRTVTVSAATTAGYAVGEYKYDLQVTIGSNVYTWMAGYIQIIDQITS